MDVVGLQSRKLDHSGNRRTLTANTKSHPTDLNANSTSYWALSDVNPECKIRMGIAVFVHKCQEVLSAL